MQPNSVAIFYSGDNYLKSADATHTFYQRPDTFYLTGIDQEETILVLFPDAPNSAWREVLFLKETSDLIKIWEGSKYTIAEGSSISGIDNVQWNKSAEGLIGVIMNYAQRVYVNLNEHDRAQYDGDYMGLRQTKKLMRQFPGHTYDRSAPILSKLRTAKDVEEISTMQKAADITSATFVKLLKEIKHFRSEHEIEAFIGYEFQKSRATHAYNPIIASGENSCVLHYNENDKPLVHGEILLMDFGCSYANYASDLSRTIPVNGKFTVRQKQIYNATLDVFKACRDMTNSSISLFEFNNEGKKIMEKKLIEIGLLSQDEVDKQDKNNPLYKKYFPHGVGHFLGLDVHDVGNHYEKMPENAVITNEPGIYIWEERLGVRIENDFIVTKTGVTDLFQSCPIEADEIESLMN